MREMTSRLTRQRVLVGIPAFLAGFVASLFVVSSFATEPAEDIEPGASRHFHCATEMGGEWTTQEATLSCATLPPSSSSPTASSTPSSSATPTPTPTSTPTSTPIPTIIPTPSPSPSPTQSASPPPATACGAGVVGYGAGTTGGTGGPTTTVTSLAQLRSELAQTGPETLVLAGSGVWNLNGQDLAVSRNDKTIDGSGAPIVFKGGSIRITASNIELCHIRSRSGDETGNGGDLDPITVNGNQRPVRNIVLDHVESLWGPDTSGAFLGDVADVTIQWSIFGEGLLRSTHPESTEDADGHSLSANFAGVAMARITIVDSLFTSSQSRSPRIIAADGIDIVDSVFYGYDEPPQGNPRCLNIVGSTWKHGPHANAAGIGPPSRLLWRFQPGSEDTSLNAGSVWIAGGQTIGFSAQAPSGNDAAVLRTSPCGTVSATSAGSSVSYNLVLDGAGPAPRDAQTQRLISNVRNGTGAYFNGHDFPPPNPVWP